MKDGENTKKLENNDDPKEKYFFRISRKFHRIVFIFVFYEKS